MHEKNGNKTLDTRTRVNTGFLSPLSRAQGVLKKCVSRRTDHIGGFDTSGNTCSANWETRTNMAGRKYECYEKYCQLASWLATQTQG